MSGCPYIVNADRTWRPPTHPDGGGKPDRIDPARLAAWVNHTPVRGEAEPPKTPDGLLCPRDIVSLDIESLVTSTYSILEEPVLDANYQEIGRRKLTSTEITENGRYIAGHLKWIRQAVPGLEVVVYGGAPCGPAYWPIQTNNDIALNDWRRGNNFAMSRCWGVLDTVGVSIYPATRDARGKVWQKFADGMLAEANRLAAWGGRWRRVYAYIRLSNNQNEQEFISPDEHLSQLVYLADHQHRPHGVIVWDHPAPWREGCRYMLEAMAKGAKYFASTGGS